MIWIHGFENTEKIAQENGASIVSGYKKANKGKCDVYNFIWNSNLGKLHFRAAAEAAREVGKNAFKKFVLDLKRKCPDTVLHVGTHSLGAAVILSALESRGNMPKIENVFLVNPAVDNESLGDGEEFQHAPERAKLIHIFYSKEDDTLEFWYPLGSFNVALGENGVDCWGSYPSNIYQYDYTKHFDDNHSAVYDHSKDKEKQKDMPLWKVIVNHTPCRK